MKELENYLIKKMTSLLLLLLLLLAAFASLAVCASFSLPESRRNVDESVYVEEEEVDKDAVVGKDNVAETNLFVDQLLESIRPKLRLFS